MQLGSAISRRAFFLPAYPAPARDAQGGNSQVDLKAGNLGDDPLAIYKPAGAKNVGATKAMAPTDRQGRAVAPSPTLVDGWLRIT